MKFCSLAILAALSVPALGSVRADVRVISTRFSSVSPPWMPPGHMEALRSYPVLVSAQAALSVEAVVAPLPLRNGAEADRGAPEPQGRSGQRGTDSQRLALFGTGMVGAAAALRRWLA